MTDEFDGVDLFGDSPDRAVFDLWRSLLLQLFDDAVLERRGELRERRSPKRRGAWDQRLVLWGGVLACEQLMPELAFAGASLAAVQDEAETAAWEWFRTRNELGKALAA